MPGCNIGSTAIVGAGLTGSLIALELAERGQDVALFEAGDTPLSGASLVNEGKIHLGFVYANDPSMRTAARMVEGALVFRPLLEHWIAAAEFDGLITDRFDYIVPEASQRTPDEVRSHFSKVAAIWSEMEGSTGLNYLGLPASLRWHALADADYSDRVKAAFETGERSVDSFIIAEILTRCLIQHPRIDLHTGHKVSRFNAVSSLWEVQSETGGRTCRHGPFDTVVNTSWNGRRAIDHASGFPDNSHWITRYKCGVDFTAPTGAPPPARNVTAMLGTYGDYVSYPSGRHYLSWYPVGLRLAETELNPKAPALDGACRKRILDESFLGLEQLIPTLRELRRHAGPEHVNGGFIVARGKTDINDRHSELHERHHIGVQQLDHGYFTVDTGKYTLAPLLASECAAFVLGNKMPVSRRLAG